MPSVRRNPLIADVFDRLGYMERKGSGFGKIIDAYRHQVNYTDDKQPIFRSDRSNFFVIMPNLNYDSQEKIFGTQDVNIGTQENAACTPNKDKCGTQRQLNGTQGGTQGVAQSVTQKTSSSIQATETTPKTAKINKAQDKLLQLISKNAKITTEKMASAMGVSVRTIKRRISEMPNIEYVGSGYSGHWKINTDAHKK